MQNAAYFAQNAELFALINGLDKDKSHFNPSKQFAQFWYALKNLRFSMYSSLFQNMHFNTSNYSIKILITFICKNKNKQIKRSLPPQC